MSRGYPVNDQPREHFLDTLVDLPAKDQLQFLASAAGNLIRALAEDHHESRAAVDRFLVLTEKAAGLRL